MNAEEAFLPHLEKLHRRFPKLRIVLEHTTTATAVRKVRVARALATATSRGRWADRPALTGAGARRHCRGHHHRPRTQWHGVVGFSLFLSLCVCV
jgi:dihydroorotase